MLSTISAENKECILSGDINCNFLVSSDHKEMKSILTYFGLKQLITSPTRIDVICSNVPHTPYSKMAAILVFFCLLENEPLLPRLRENILLKFRV